MSTRGGPKRLSQNRRENIHVTDIVFGHHERFGCVCHARPCRPDRNRVGHPTDSTETLVCGRSWILRQPPKAARTGIPPPSIGERGVCASRSRCATIDKRFGSRYAVSSGASAERSIPER